MTERVTLEEVRVLRLKPGDVIMFTIKEHVPRAQRVHFENEVEEMFPNNRVVVVAGNVEVSVIREEDPKETP